MTLTTAVTYLSLGAAVILFVLGAVATAQSWAKKVKVQEVADLGAQKAKEAQQNANGAELGTFQDGWNALASLASALKDLDPSTRLFTLSLAFLAVAGATVGLDSIATAVSS